MENTLRTFAIIILLTVFTLSAMAQKQTTHVQQAWFAYFNQTRISEHWGLWADLHLRTKEDFVNDLSTGIIRVGLTYFAHDHLRFTAGYGFINHFPAEGHTGVSMPEHRPWQQVQWMNNSKRSRLTNAIRLEERYRRKIANNDELGEGYNFNFRVRHNLLFMVPLSRQAFTPGTFSFVLNNEIHINFGKQIVNNYFDQNRLFGGFTYHISPHGQIQFGYMNLFQQLAAGNRYRSIHAGRINYFHTLDLRKNG